VALKCFRRFDATFHGEEEQPSANVAGTSSGYQVDPNWYSDTGATDHITSDLDRLSFRERYNGTDNVQVGNGAGLHIEHIGQSSVNTSAEKPLALRNVLHVPKITKNLISTHRLTNDNDVSVEYFPSFFVVKDLATRKSLLRGPCRGGLYPFLPSTLHHDKAAMLASVNKKQWHHRLGHPSSQVVQSILSLNKLPFSGTHDASVCDACQQAKSHQLPYSLSSFVAKFPLELVYSDVWGPATVSVGGYKYYVSFIDAFSKFTWIYLLHAKSEVEQVFVRFQTHVERLLGRKILRIQSDWGGEYQHLHKYLQTHGISHHVSCPYTHQQNGAAERKHRHMLKLDLLFLLIPTCRLGFGTRRSSLQPFLLIVFPLVSLTMLHPWNAFLSLNLTIPCLSRSAVPVGPTSVP
jgi:histone deacetylase 1/2